MPRVPSRFPMQVSNYLLSIYILNINLYFRAAGHLAPAKPLDDNEHDKNLALYCAVNNTARLRRWPKVLAIRKWYKSSRDNTAAEIAGPTPPAPVELTRTTNELPLEPTIANGKGSRSPATMDAGTPGIGKDVCVQKLLGVAHHPIMCVCVCHR